MSNGWIWIVIIVVLVLLIAWWGYRSSRQAANKTESSVRSYPVEAPPVETHPVEAPSVEAFPLEAPPAIPDDLVIIEGIGPKIAEVLNTAGITTFAQLAQTGPDRLEEILNAANLRLADPTTWPEQARLAAAGDMQGLQALQDRLKGGR